MQFSISTVLFTQLNIKTVLFQAIQFSKSTQFSSTWPKDRTLSDATTPGQSGPGSNGNQGMLHILQSSGITETSPSDWLVGFNGISTFVGYLTPNPFLYK